MKLLFVADGRSPIALNWMAYFAERGHAVHLASTYPCAPTLRLASLTLIAVGGGELAGQVASAAGGRRAWLRRLLPVAWRTRARQLLAPLTLGRAAQRLQARIEELQPDLIHAMRIPYEGMLAARAVGWQGGAAAPPLLVSVWGNDFTLHAPATPWMAALTRTVLERASALHTDCQRDQRLARQWGFDTAKPAVVLPGGGGIQLDVFYPPPQAVSDAQANGDTVINPRGVRAYIRNDVFFAAIPLVLQRRPHARFLCPAMAGEAQAERWLRAGGVAHAVELLPRQPRAHMAELFRRAQVAVSPAVHDGTPNTLLEAMACGCYPVAGDIESLREWITPGINGSLVAADDAAALAEAICQALENPALRASAAAHNLRLIREKAEYGAVMARAEQFYISLAG